MPNRALLLMALLSLSLAACGPYSYRTGILLDPPNPAPALQLRDQRGQPFDLSAQAGKVTLVFFGFTNCPDVCPTTLADLSAARRQLGADGERIQIVLVTVDPERDTPERLGRYVATFDESAVALSGTPEQLSAIYQAFGVTATRRDLPDSALRYTIDHSAMVFVIDKQVRWRALISNGSKVEDIVSDLRFLVRE